MSDKVRGAIALLVGLFALYQSYVLYTAGRRDWHMGLELAAGVLLILIGIWRVQRKPFDATQVK
jgi:ABC-type nickel/cobalt efflux system permease component RcnA